MGGPTRQSGDVRFVRRAELSQFLVRPGRAIRTETDSFKRAAAESERVRRQTVAELSRSVRLRATRYGGISSRRRRQPSRSEDSPVEP